MGKLYNLARMTTATTGTGTITLGSAVAGALSFASAGVKNGETVSYAIKDGANSEVGTGVYTSSGTTLSRTVLKSTNSDAAISLSGSAEVIVTALAQDFREVLTAARTYYVRTDGADTNSGLADTAAGAFLTIQKAIDVASSLDLNGYNVTIQVANATWTQALTLKQPAGVGTCTLQGDTTTPANCTISTTSANAITASGAPIIWTLSGLRLQTTTSGSGVAASNNCLITLSNVHFGACADNGIFTSSGAVVSVTSNYTISGGSLRHLNLIGGEIFIQNRTITITGTPAFSVAFVSSARSATLHINGSTFSGSATGTRYDAISNSVIFTNGGGATYLPGNASGTTATGGQYI